VRLCDDLRRPVLVELGQRDVEPDRDDERAILVRPEAHLGLDADVVGLELLAPGDGLDRALEARR
jgi:hypothetical protein